MLVTASYWEIHRKQIKTSAFFPAQPSICHKHKSFVISITWLDEKEKGNAWDLSPCKTTDLYNLLNNKRDFAAQQDDLTLWKMRRSLKICEAVAKVEKV